MPHHRDSCISTVPAPSTPTVVQADRPDCADRRTRPDSTGKTAGDLRADRSSPADWLGGPDSVTRVRRDARVVRAMRDSGVEPANRGMSITRVVLLDRTTWVSYPGGIDDAEPRRRGDGVEGVGGTEQTVRTRRTARGRRAGSAQREERGAVTAEMALALPVLISLLLLGIWSIGLVVLNIRCIDAARDVARAVARGESPEEATAIGRRTVPTGTIVIAREASDIKVTVTAVPAHQPPLLSLLSPTTLTATATLQAEPEETP